MQLQGRVMLPEQGRVGVDLGGTVGFVLGGSSVVGSPVVLPGGFVELLVVGSNTVAVGRGLRSARGSGRRLSSMFVLLDGVPGRSLDLLL